MFALMADLVVAPAITTDMLAPVIEMLTANIAVIMPVALGAYAVIKGVSLVPRIIGMFIH